MASSIAPRILVVASHAAWLLLMMATWDERSHRRVVGLRILVPVPPPAANLASRRPMTSSFDAMSSSTSRMKRRRLPLASGRRGDDVVECDVSAGGDDDDRAPCYDNGICISLPDEDIDEDIDDMGGNRDANGVVVVVALPPEVALTVDDGDGGGGGAMRRLGQHTGPTVWSEFGRLAQMRSESGMDLANLGQGFPDWPPPDFAVRGLVDAASSSTSSHQYTRTAGHPALVRQLARRYSTHMDRSIDPMGEVAVTVGASQALYLCLQTLVEPGICDEVILFEPFFDLYANQIRLAGGVPVYVPLTFVPGTSSSSSSSSIVGGGGGTWILESDRLRERMSHAKTCAVILNSPHNPTGKVFTYDEMLSISNIVSNYAGPKCVVISDEVYKYIVHSPPREEVDANVEEEERDGSERMAGHASTSNGIVRSGGGGRRISRTTTASCPGHVHFASLPNMWDRTITVSSAGKTFSATGWQVGWCIGPSRLISSIHRLLPYVQFCASTVMQEALARTLPFADMPYMGHDNYYDYLNDKYRRKRDLLAKALVDVGFEVPDYENNPGWGGFFIFARITSRVREALPPCRLEAPFSINAAAPGGDARLDWALCQWMVEEIGVLCIPSSPFFSRERALEGASDEFIRVAFCKTDETIERAAVALRKMTSLTGDEGNNSNEEEDANVVIGMEAVS
jgi:kynurenine--oxoglutarate transaminase/cysteine-S-conjugate beta-lyase/glutamine--phenylpyruvate transaminase